MKSATHFLIPLFALLLIGAGCRSASLPRAAPASPATPQASGPAEPSASAGPCPLTEALVREYCTVVSPLIVSPPSPFARCGISVKPGAISIPLIVLFERPWRADTRALATTDVYTTSGGRGTLPSWDVAGVGDLAFITPFSDPAATLGTLESGDGFNLNVKDGDTVRQLVSYGRAATGTADLCGLESTKAIGRAIIGE